MVCLLLTMSVGPSAMKRSNSSKSSLVEREADCAGGE